MTVELFRPVSLTKIGAAGLKVMVRATTEECAALAGRMDIPAIQSLECAFLLTREQDGLSVFAAARLRAQVTRTCVVSAEDFEMPVEEEFDLRFVPGGTERDDPDPGLPDEIPYDGNTIDLGEAAAEQLGLTLDPYPRMPGVTLTDTADDGGASPFSTLSARGKLQ
jgi:uncharacterized metal-binding protein YceD (DUF177 family)